MLILLLFMASTSLAQKEKTPEEELLMLYNTALENWKRSDNVSKLVSENPELQKVVNNMSGERIEDFKGVGMKMNFLSFFEGDLVDREINAIIMFLSTENITIIEDLYWSIINSERSKDISNVVVNYMLKAKEDLEKRIQKLDIKN